MFSVYRKPLQASKRCNLYTKYLVYRLLLRSNPPTLRQGVPYGPPTACRWEGGLQGRKARRELEGSTVKTPSRELAKITV